MKLNSAFLTHETQDEHYLFPTGESNFKGLIKNNETAAFIIEALKNDTTEAAIVDKILNEYEDAERAVVESDVADIISRLRSIGAISE